MQNLTAVTQRMTEYVEKDRTYQEYGAMLTPPLERSVSRCSLLAPNLRESAPII